jgi:predicted transcriptional regulator
MEVRLKPETELRLGKLASKSGRPTDDLIEDAMAGYLAEVSETRGTLDNRYDDVKNRALNTLDGEAFFEDLRRREGLLLKKQSPE